MESYSYRMFMCFTRKYKINEARPPPDVQEAFAKYAGAADKGGAHMTAEQLQQFLIEYQGEEDSSRSESESVRVINHVTHKRHNVASLFRKNNGLAVEDFFHYLFDDSLNGPINTEVHHDMTAPLQHYFIFTGHNSYLTGNQLNSDCSDVPIIKALQRGVRVIELDIWPNNTKDDIDVLHGGTLTAPVPLIKCLRSIRDHAFENCPYPVIITLEDHLTHDLQAKVAKMVTDIFGEMLYYPEKEHLEEFPSPEELKHRILLSTKPPKEYLECKTSTVIEENTNSATDKKNLPGDPEVQVSLEEKNEDDQADQGSEKDDEDDDDDEELAEGIEEGKFNQSSSELTYKKLIAIRAGKPKNGLKEALSGGLEKNSRLSLNEQAIEKAAANFGTDVVRFTQKNFLRIYPKGSRVDSSNYHPMVSWTHGAQMVAFNMQGYGHLLWMMHGMFRGNGSCGYLKKPDFLMNNKVFDPNSSMDVKTILKVKVYTGDGWRLDFSKTHFDMYSPPDFYTKLRIVGVEADCEKKQTRPIEDDWVPVWDEEFTFNLRVPELALLRIEVREYDMAEKDDFAGQTCLPVSEIKQGFRAVPLFDKKGDRLPSVRLFMRFQFVSPSEV